MRRFVLGRLAVAVLTLLVVSAATFGLFFGVPADPAVLHCGTNCTAGQIAAVAQRLELHHPLHVQYLDYLRGIITGRTLGDVYCAAPCLGYSFQDFQPVTPMIGRALPVTLSIVLGAAVLWVVVGTALGFAAAWYRDTWVERFIGGLTLLAASTQTYFVGLFLLVVLVYGLGWLPHPVYVSPTADPAGWLTGMLLPWSALTVTHLALHARLTRTQLLETLSADHVRTAAAKGISRARVYLRHALRVSASPLLTVTGLQVGVALGGAAITETVFGMPGMGVLGARAAVELDLPVVMGTVLVAAFFVVLANLLVDLAYAALDHRVTLR